MGHHINALIGTPEALSSLAQRFSSPAPTEVPFGLIVIPLDEERLDEIAMSVEPAIEGFTYLTPTMAEKIVNGVQGPALYVETDYFGGLGGQRSAYFENGRLSWWGADSTFQPEAGTSLADLFERTAATGKAPINEGLARLGVSRSADRDEFDQIGLGRFRSLEDLGIEYDD